MDKSELAKYGVSFLAVATALVSVPAAIAMGITEIGVHIIIDKIKHSKNFNNDTDKQLEKAFNNAKKSTFNSIHSERQKTLIHLISRNFFSESSSVSHTIDKALAYMAEYPEPDEIKFVATIFEKNLYMEFINNNKLNCFVVEKLLTLEAILVLNSNELMALTKRYKDLNLRLTILENNAFYSEVRAEAFRDSHNSVNIANEMYEKSFTESLFLHKSDAKVSLINLFVYPKYQVVSYDSIEDGRTTLVNYLSYFINNDKNKDFLFIEGDAGCGKSSLVSYLCYYYKNCSKMSEKIFNGRNLITVRLRDLDTNKISSQRELVGAILDYLNIKSIDSLELLYPNAVLLLDGFDELCMIQDINSHAERFIYDISAFKKFKKIITTRPKYLKVQSLDISKRHIMLKHFNSKQRNEWLHRFENDCNQQIKEEVRGYLARISDDDAFGICDTPLSLYMIVAGKIDNDALYNEWALYNQIFYKELSETEYNSMFPNDKRKYSHGIALYRDIIYRISEEIAYKMYSTGNSRLYLSDVEIKKIIVDLGIQDVKTKELAERCYALCSYWKANSDRGVIEFYHNNIRDFFLCEKIFRELNNFFENIKNNLGFDVNWIMELFYKLFQFGDLETTVSKFILLRAYHGKDTNRLNDFPIHEYEKKYLPIIFENMLVFGFSNSNFWIGPLDGKERYVLNPTRITINIISCLIQIYGHIYEPYLQKGETIKWWNDVDKVNDSGILKMLFKHLFIKTPITLDYEGVLTLSSKADFSKVDLHSADIRNAGFHNAILKNAILENAILCGSDFENADLSGADFCNADIHHASLSRATLISCKMIGADLRGTKLPDNFFSPYQEEQIEHLKSLNIDRLQI
ncbi:MAG: pentapeptide repeat-containing protein [Defluviitaleaceae bacterium]|nr:pentapeptide repeat-containing protein [Defluviitaleaceae bacterium]